VDNFTTRFSPWLLFFEDNIQRVTAVKRSHYDLPQIRPTSREIYHTVEYSPQRVIMKMREDIQLAEEIGACFGGYACNDNHYFRKKKHRHVAFVWTKMAYCKRGGPKWPEYAEEKDDYAYTAECLSRGMPVVVNNYLYPWSVRYEGRGGSRTIKERAKDRRQVVRELERRFPGMFRLKHKPNSPEGTEIQLSVCTEKQLEKWRKEHATAR
jgi:hypothetical protein